MEDRKREKKKEKRDATIGKNWDLRSFLKFQVS